MEFLEKNKGWKEPDFDTVLQYLRTVLLRRKNTLQSVQSLVADLLQMVPPSSTRHKTRPPSSLFSSTRHSASPLS